MSKSSSPIWLSAEQQRVWRTYLLGSARLNEKLDADLRQFGLDLGEYEILVTLSEAEARQCRMSDLADAVHQSRSRLTHTITRMERRGLVERVSCPTDRRGVWARLTDGDSGCSRTPLRATSPPYARTSSRRWTRRTMPRWAALSPRCSPSTPASRFASPGPLMSARWCDG